MAQAWTLTQIGGNQTSITFKGYSAPFGRLRKGPVVKPRFKLRESKTYYAGVRAPSRHIFGDQEDSLVLHGRWSDQTLQLGGMQDLVAQVKQLFADQQLCLLKWGDILSYRVLPTEFEAGLEGAADCTWEMTFDVDEDLNLAQLSQPVSAPRSPINQMNLALADLVTFKKLALDLEISEDLIPDFLYLLESFIDKIASATAAFVNAVNAIQDYESAVASQLNRLRGAINQIRTAVVGMQELVESVAIEGILFERWADGDLKWLGFKNNAGIASDSILAIFSDMESDIETAERGTGAISLKASQGDTWETLSVKAYGNTGGGLKIRDANGATYGAQPNPGQTYLIPSAA